MDQVPAREHEGRTVDARTRTVDARRYWGQRHDAHRGLDGVGVTALGPAFNRWAYRVRGASFEAALRPFLAETPPRRVLDVGSGTGFYLDRWHRLGAGEVVASDLAPEACERLRTAFPANEVLRLDIGAADAIAEAGLEPGAYDYVSAMDVLFHILGGQDYKRAFANAAALLKPGGYFLFSEDLLPGRGVRRQRIKVARSERRTRGCWEAAGMVEVHRSPFLWSMNSPSAGTRRERRRFMRLTRLLQRAPWLGGPLAAVLYPIERHRTGVTGNGPSTKIVVCRKPKPTTG